MRARDRRGRGRRGPEIVPRVLGRPERPTRAERFDRAVLAVAAELEGRWGDRLPVIEYAVEDVPPPADPPGSGERPDAVVPLSSLVPADHGSPARIVLFRRPVESRCLDRAEVRAVVHALVVEHVADLLGLDAAEVDHRYRDEDDRDP